MSTERNLRKTRVGKVVSDKMDKTVTALRSWKHARFPRIRDGALPISSKRLSNFDIKR